MRKSGLTRKTPLRSTGAKTAAKVSVGPTRGAWINRTPKKPANPKKALPKSNPERQAKRRKQYAQKLAAYKRSETYRIVEARANGQCEYDQMPIVSRADHLRCDALRAAGDRLTHHHKTYARFGGKELPEDIAVLCDTHNAHVESQHPTRNRNYR